MLTLSGATGFGVTEVLLSVLTALSVSRAQETIEGANTDSLAPTA